MLRLCCRFFPLTSSCKQLLGSVAAACGFLLHKSASVFCLETVFLWTDRLPVCFSFSFFLISQPRWTWKWKWTHVTPACCQILLLSQFFPLSESVCAEFTVLISPPSADTYRANSLWIIKLFIWFCVGAAAGRSRPSPLLPKGVLKGEGVSAVNQMLIEEAS